MGYRAIGTAVLALALAATLGACSRSTSLGGVLSAHEVRNSVITLHDLGPLYVVDPGTSPKGKRPLGCLTQASKTFKADEVVPVHHDHALYKANTLVNSPRIASSVATMRTTAQAAEQVARFKAAYAACTHVSATDAKGAHAELSVTLDDRQSTTAVTRQENVTAIGTITGHDFTTPIGTRISVIQIRNQVLLVDFVTLGDTPTAVSEELDRRAVARLRAATTSGSRPSLPPLDLHVDTDRAIQHG